MSQARTPPLTSVIVPVFNGAAHLEDALASIGDQDYPLLEVVVVDDGSTDDTARVAASALLALESARLPRKTRYVFQDNAGPAAARNAGIAASSGDYLAFLDSDDLLPRTKISCQMKHLLDHPDTAAVVGRQQLVVEPGAPLPHWAMPGGLRSNRSDEPIPPLSVVLSRRVADDVGTFDERYRQGEDLDWLLRLQERGHRLDVLDAVVVHRRVHRASLTQDVTASRRSAFRALHGRVERHRARG